MKIERYRSLILGAGLALVGLAVVPAHAAAAPKWRVRTDAALGGPGAQATVLDAVPAGDGSPWLLGGTWQAKPNAVPQPVTWTTTVRERLPKWNWKRGALPLPKRADGGTTIAMTKGVGSTIIAVGTTTNGDDSDAAVWTSSDRSSWKAFDPPKHRVPGRQALIGVAATKHGFVAVGSNGRRPLLLLGNRKGLRAVPLPAMKDFRGLRAVSSNEKLDVIIIGVAGKVGATQPFALVSHDEGRTWDTSEPFPTHSSTEIIGVANLGGTYLGVGSEITPAGRSLMLWRSNDGGIRWRRAPNGVVDRDTGDPKDPTGLVPVAITRDGTIAIYDERARRSLYSFVDNSLTVNTFKVDVAPAAFDLASGPIVLHGGFGVTVSYGGGRPNVSILDLASARWITEPDPEYTDSNAFPKRTLSRTATLVVPIKNGTRFIGSEGPIHGPIRGKKPGPPTYRTISWLVSGGSFPTPSVLKLPLGTSIQAAVRANGATFLFGSAPDGRGFPDGVEWRYADDGKLTQVKTTGLGGPGGQTINGAAYSDGQWLAVGAFGPDDKGGTDAGLWYSDDGETWQLRSTAAMAGAGDQVARAVCAGSSGEPIVVGTTTNTQGIDIPAVWYPNAQDWRMVLPAGNKAGQLTSCASSEDGVVAVGPYANDALLWHSTNGRTWTSTALPVSSPGISQPSTVGASDSGVVVSGSVDDGTGTGNVDLAVWAVPKGGKPRRVPDGAGFRGAGIQSPSSLSLQGTRLMIAGSSGPSARVWDTPNVFAR